MEAWKNAEKEDTFDDSGSVQVRTDFYPFKEPDVDPFEEENLVVEKEETLGGCGSKEIRTDVGRFEEPATEEFIDEVLETPHQSNKTNSNVESEERSVARQLFSEEQDISDEFHPYPNDAMDIDEDRDIVSKNKEMWK